MVAAIERAARPGRARRDIEGTPERPRRPLQRGPGLPAPSWMTVQLGKAVFLPLATECPDGIRASRFVPFAPIPSTMNGRDPGGPSCSPPRCSSPSPSACW